MLIRLSIGIYHIIMSGYIQERVNPFASVKGQKNPPKHGGAKILN